MNLRQFFISNKWWGKLLGCFFGYLMAGPAGALFGILIGNFFDRGLATHFSNAHWYFYEEKRLAVQKVFIETVFTVMAYVARANGRISENQIQMAQQLMDEMSLNHQQKSIAKDCFNEGKQPAININAVLDLLKDTCQDNVDLLKHFIDIQYRAAQVDGLSTKKLQALDSIFKRLGFAPLHQQYRYYEDFHHRTSNRSYQQNSSGPRYSEPGSTVSLLTQAYALLGVKPDASKQDVKRAYRRLISRNHPDKLIAKGLPEERIKQANEKTQQITRAYELVCTSKGW